MAVAALLLAACSHATSSYTAPPKSPMPSSTSMTLATSSASGLGTVLTAPNGQTLYLLSADKGGTPTCTSSACTGVWPPLLVTGASSPNAGSGANAGLLGTVTTPSGATQVTYNNWPVYMYSGDSGPGQSNGEKIQSFGGTWYAVSSSGKPATGSSSASGSSGGGGGGGGGY
jgi:predicted lipoprotein with Yx(FWY)xxD motif